MNAKGALKSIEAVGEYNSPLSVGFLEAVEKFKPVVEAQEKFIDDLKRWWPKEPDGNQVVSPFVFEMIQALESYRRDVLGVV